MALTRSETVLDHNRSCWQLSCQASDDKIMFTQAG
jgi:hypothetical protein